ncbi:MAG: carboxypeptidase-like regulatory domain-containing protein [Acidobacteriota bacterium]
MNQGRTLFSLFCFLFALTALGASTANAQIYSGRATGINSTVTVSGNPTTTTVADTCPLSPTGGSHIATTPLGIVSGLLRTGPITSTTSGAGNSSQSSSTVQDLNLAAGGYTIRATSVGSTAQCNCCTPTMPTCGGRTTIAGLTVTDPAGAPVTIVPNGTVNQTVSLGTAGSIIINEQTTAAGSITVNALHINITGTNGTNSNVIVASSHSDIECQVTSPTPANVSVSGRVVDANGRAIGRVTVTLTNGADVLKSQSNAMGNFSFAEVEAGPTYILEASSPFYTFSPVVLRVLDEVSDAEIRATSGASGLK